MVLEALAAVLLGLAALWLVLGPLLRSRASTSAAYEPLELEETPKGVALAALKEIEFDRETGKLSDADYDFLKTRYTAEALEALRAEEEAGTNDIEALIAAKVRTLRSASAPTSLDTPTPQASQPTGSIGYPACDNCGPRPESDAIFCSSCGGRLDASAPCASCGAPLVPRSRFCEGCGQPVAA